MLVHAIYIVFAYLIDRIIGDPRILLHPVVIIGKFISRLEKAIRFFTVKEKYMKLAGLLFPILIAGGSYLIITLVLYGLDQLNHVYSVIVEIWLISTTIATKGLADAGLEVFRHLKNQDLRAARKSLGMIVGRDTENLEESEISRGAVETVAENIVDAIISPLCFALIGGAPLAMFYRAVNTLDSMVGYKNEKYQNLGWASARLDDLLNYLPARLTFGMMLLACLIKRLDVLGAWKMMKRDAKLHPSPNSGYPEATIAGALQIQLGGTNYYFGKVSERAKMGEPLRKIKADDILLTVIVMKTTSIICVVLFMLLSILVELGMK
ncbi:adenosylcobinamide-phosphate synthase CbiB [Bacillus sp. AFS055030]|uniref:adenosylcobinamide-phosphate synthase CbiB n=1 Tax=Bacillus sp. AFS055030 TaxID=2033507 RepID=UPI000BFCE67A|nr:adenosylcobinamide-phosphate synthase CbiB [Bacillus sp. AFS055030]PGL68814.1 cobalamin biosynthesis protein CobD [Bacillus sp. AFS055030]